MYETRIKQQVRIKKNLLLCKKTQLYIPAFHSSYHVESGFSRNSNLLSKSCNRLDIYKKKKKKKAKRIVHFFKNISLYVLNLPMINEHSFSIKFS